MASLKLRCLVKFKQILQSSTQTSKGYNRRFTNSSEKCQSTSPVPLTETWPAENEKKQLSTDVLEKAGATKVPDFDDPAFQKINLSFDDPKFAFMSKSNGELFRALFVFNLCSVPFVVNHNKEFLKLARNVLGHRLFVWLMKKTFYGQFVAGEDITSIRPVAEKNLEYGVKSILDYSVEKDLSKEKATSLEKVSCSPGKEPILPTDSAGIYNYDRYRVHEEFGDRREDVFAARTYFYEDEAQCDRNMEVFLECVDGVAGATNASGFAAIKMTALGRPQLLMNLSEVLLRVSRHFEMLSTYTGNQSGKIGQVEFERYLKRINLDKEQRRQWFTLLDSTKDGEIDLFDWFNLLEVNLSLARVLRVPNAKTGALEPLVTQLTDQEELQMKNMLRRIDTIVKSGQEKDVRVMIDAEQTYFQPAINRLTMEMMRKYNKEKAIVFNTYQCYLKDALSNVCTDLALSYREDFFFGAKLVRGAYMEQERKRAATVGYMDPINPTFEATSKMYQNVFEEFLKYIQLRPKGKVAAMLATHNEDTIRWAVNRMKEAGVMASDRVICFGQLLGMCDQVSFSLGQAGYSVYKYVPYGPVEEVLPYLSRRAMENRGILDKVKKEKRMLRSELFRRIRTGKLLYKPPRGPLAGKMGLPLAMLKDKETDNRK